MVETILAVAVFAGIIWVVSLITLGPIVALWKVLKK